MALDGMLLHIITRQLEQQALASRIEKISMPRRDCMILTLSSRDFSGRLLLSCSPGSPRVHLTTEKFENPATPPMLCMLLRKRFTGGRLQAVRQAGLDRILFLDFACKNELGDEVILTIAVEILGGMSNILLLQDGRIIDCVRRFDPEEGKRFLLPGAIYELPPAQQKINILTQGVAPVIQQLRTLPDMPVDKALMQTIDGVCPLVCRELCTLALRDLPRLSAVSAEGWQRLEIFLGRLPKLVEHPVFTCVADQNGQLRDFTFMPVTQYGSACVTREYASAGELLDRFYTDRDKAAHIRQAAAGLLKLLTNLHERTSRKIQLRRQELQATKDREHLRIYGELLKANLHQIHAGDAAARVVNYYDPDCKTIEIPLDTALSPSANAQKYFKEYKKASVAAGMLDELIQKAQDDLIYIDSVFDALSRAGSVEELAAIRQELEDAGLLRQARKTRQKPKALPYLQYRSDDGFLILCGRNNIQNDRLTLKQAEKTDIWLHTKNLPGSHVIIAAGHAPIPERTLLQAANIAACNSKGALSSGVPVEYTLVKHVKKPAGAKPGMVIYTNNKTLYVTPDTAEVRRLLADDCGG